MTSDFSHEINLPQGWKNILASELKSSYMQKLMTFIQSEYRSKEKKIFPPKNKIFKALELVDFEDVKVVILGQDPYHNEGQANGLAFAVENTARKPPSLVNIFKEVASDLNNDSKINSNLEHWAKQGVLLLNTYLTVQENAPLSHKNSGWETFTDKIITSLNKKKTPVVFLLWGSHAQLKAKLINSPKHKILKSTHPSPLSAYRGFLGCKHFSKTNEFLKLNHLNTIDWCGNS